MSSAKQLDQHLHQASSSSSSPEQQDRIVVLLNQPTDMSRNAPNANQEGSNVSLSSASDSEEDKRKHSAVPASLEVNHSGNRSEEEESESVDQETAPPEKKRRRRRKSHSMHDDIIANNPDLDLHNDLTTVEGQLKRNPNLTQQEAETASKREYNRRNAARARLRNKHMVAELQEQCAILTQRTEDLTRENEILRAQLELLQKQPTKLKPESNAPTAAPTSSLNNASAILGHLSGAAPPWMGGIASLHSPLLFGSTNAAESILQHSTLGLPTTLVAPELLRQLQQRQAQQQQSTTQPPITSSLDFLTQFVQEREQTARSQALLAALLNRNNNSSNKNNINDSSSGNN